MDHTYTKPGIYIANLTIADACGISFATRTIRVYTAETTGNGNLRGDTVPEGAMFSLDNYPIGTTPLSSVDITAGVHYIRISMTGYDDYLDDLTVNPGQIIDLKVMLTRSGGPSPNASLPPAPSSPRSSADSPLKQALTKPDLLQTASGDRAGSTGTLMVSSNPVGANVYLDGKSVGTMPLTLLISPQGSIISS